MIILFSVLGVVLASFYVVIATRIPNKESILKPSSHCDSCKEKLKWYELIPLLSYIFLGGKCKHCKNKIPFYTFLVELLEGILFALGYHLYGISYELFAYLIIVSLMTIIFVSDFKYLVIIDSPLFISLALILILKFVYFGFNPFIKALLAGLIIFSFLLFVKICGDKFFHKESLGWGDVKLSLFMGATLGLKLGLTSLIIGSFIALPYALIYIMKKQEKEIPYGPFLILGVFICFVFMGPISEFINMLFLINQ